MINFLTSHWVEIVDVTVLVLSILFFILKKPLSSSVNDTLKVQLSQMIASWINQVECPGNGLTKKDTVVSLGLHYVKKVLHRALTTDEEFYWRKALSDMIEDYLSTPKKKEI